MAELLGISTDDRLVHRAVLGRPDLTVGGLAARTEVSPEGVAASLRALADRGLLHEDRSRPCGFSVTRPDVVLDHVLESEQSRLDAEQERLASARRYSSDATADFFAGRALQSGQLHVEG